MRDSKTERIGVYTVGLIFTKDISWVFREQTVVDVGIDALIEESVEGNPTGQFIAAQIKTGLGNFHETSDSLIYYVSNIHYNYWLNFNLPVLLIAHLPETNKTCWQVISEKSLVPTKKHWKINIPKKKELNSSSLNELSTIVNNSEVDIFTIELKLGEISEELIQQIISETSFITEARYSLDFITDIITELGEVTEVNRKKIEYFGQIGLKQNDKRVKALMKRYGIYIDSVARKINIQIINFSEDFSLGIRAYEKLTSIHFHHNKDYKSIEETYSGLISLTSGIDEGIDGSKQMRSEVSTLPNNFSHLKKAKNNLIETINQLLDEFKIAKEITLHFMENVKKIID